MTIVSGTDAYKAILESYGTVRFNSLAPLGTETFVSYSFFDSWPTYGASQRIGTTTLPPTSIETISSTQRAAIRTALDQYTAVSGLTFIEVPGNATTRGDLVFGMVSDIVGYSGLTYLPYEAMDRYSESLSGEVWLSRVDVGNMTIGSWGYYVAIHEIGHGIGFKHPHQGDPTLSAGEDNTGNTVMSYNVSPTPTQLGSIDVTAAQYLYGTRNAANVNGVTGAWDAASQRVSIAGSSAAENIVGTGWRDTISAGGGADTVNAGSGDDIVSGGDGNDILNGSVGNDTLSGGAGNDTLGGDSGNDVAVFSRPRWEYSFSSVGGVVTVSGLTSAAAGADGVDRLSGVEFIEAAGVRVAVSTAVSNALATATATGATVTAGARRVLTDFFTTSDANGDAIQLYQFIDRTAGNGRLIRVIAPGNEVDLSATPSAVNFTSANLSSIFFEGGSGGTTDVIEVQLYDGREWSQPTISITSTGGAVNRAPTVAAGATSSINVGATVAASSLFTASDPDGNTITSYEFTDNGAGGGQFRLGGVAQASGQAITVTAAQLSNLVYAGGGGTGVETISVRASDGVLWSSALSLSLTTVQPNRAPNVVAGGISNVAAGAVVAAASLFTASDPDGNAITSYEFTDNGAGGGQFRLGGVAQASGQAITVTAAQLVNLVYAAGAGGGVETISVRASDGALWSNALSISMTTDAAAVPPPSNAAPVIGTGIGSVGANQWALASTLFNASDPEGSAITAYRFTDLTSGNGYLWNNGTTIAAEATFEVTATQLPNVWFRSSTSGPVSDTLRVEAFDGTSWGSRDLSIATAAPNRAPTLSATSATSVQIGGSISVAAMFTAMDLDGDAITSYELLDAPGGGQIRVGGVAQSAGAIFSLTPSQLNNSVYEGGSGPASETIWIRAKDALQWSNWMALSATTIAGGAVNRAPNVAAGAISSVNVGATVAASSLFTASDPDGNAITSYEFTDNGAGFGQFSLGGVAQASGQTITVTAAQLASLVYAGGASGGVETISVRASDGALWSSALSLSLTTLQPNRAPNVAAGAISSVNVGATVAASSLFTASDPDGNAITSYEFTDNGAGGGQFSLGGVAQVSGQAITVTAAQLASLVYAGGVSGGVDTISVRASDGALWSNALSLAVTTNAAAIPPPSNAAPIVSAGIGLVGANQWALANTLFTATDPEGGAITAYRFTDLTSGNGYLWNNGTTIATGATFEVTATQLPNVWFRSSTSGPVSDTLRVEAFDGTSWGSRDLSIATAAPNRAPTLSATGATSVHVGGAISVAGMFTANDVDGDAITAYELLDAPGGGSIRVGGVAQPVGTIISATPAQFANSSYQGASTAGSETLWIRAKDATLWSNWMAVSATTITNPAGTAEYQAASSRLSFCGCPSCTGLGTPWTTSTGSNDLGKLQGLFGTESQSAPDSSGSENSTPQAGAGSDTLLADTGASAERTGINGILTGILR